MKTRVGSFPPKAMNRMKMPKRKTSQFKKKDSPTVGFRLDDEVREALEDRAKGLRVSYHELARIYVIEALLEPEVRTEMTKFIAALHHEVCELREDVSLAVQALLVYAGKASEEEALAYVKENFKTE